ncbi:MAG: NUDIX domain-containing protein [Alphaproteobacteria bacterium]|nr:NUDIX domain-containing protein [Alphaproteobacteria bacterium]
MKIKNVTLLAVIDVPNNRVLMTRRLRGMKGFSNSADGHARDLYNLPGGKKGEDESFIDAAVRETIEETGVTPINPKLCGQLQFVWTDVTLVCQVFKTFDWKGDIDCKPGGECTAHWIDLDKLPYDNMWADDRTWFPDMMNDKFFHYDVIVADEKSVKMVPLPTDGVI